MVYPSRNRLVSTAFACKQKKISNIKINFFSKLVKFTWKIQNRLNKKKKQISNFSNFHFSSYGHFCSKYCQLSMNFHDNSSNKIRQIVFSFVSAHCACFLKVGSKLRGGGLHVVSWDRAHLILFWARSNIVLSTRLLSIKIAEHARQSLSSTSVVWNSKFERLLSKVRKIFEAKRSRDVHQPSVPVSNWYQKCFQKPLLSINIHRLWQPLNAKLKSKLTQQQRYTQEESKKHLERANYARNLLRSTGLESKQEDLCPVDIFYHLIAIRGIFILKHPVNINI